MNKHINYNDSYIGKKYNHLTIIGLSSNKANDGHIKVICKCICGKTIEPRFYYVRKKIQKSCGCMGKPRLTHGYSKTKLYKCYNDMIHRCKFPNDKSYKNYGGRGITVCKEWSEDFLTFRFQMRKKYLNAKRKYKGERITIERIDNNKGYYYHNCTFIPRRLQIKNRRNTIPCKAINRKTGKEVYAENQTELAKKINVPMGSLNCWFLKKRRSSKWIIRPLLINPQ